MKAEITVNGPQTSPKTASTGTRQAATSGKRAASEIAPRKSASGGYNDGVGGWKWEMSAHWNTAKPKSAEPPCTDPYARWCDRESPRGSTYVNGVPGMLNRLEVEVLYPT